MRFGMKELMFSIIVPMYNCEEYIEECIESVVRQPLDCYEIICINDGSTDGTLKKISDIQRFNEQIKIFSQKNQGLSAARNAGICEAQGKYIIFLDSDDMLADNALEVLYTWAAKEDNDIFVYDVMSIIYENEQLKSVANKNEFHKRKGKYSEINSGSKLFVKMMWNNDFNESAWLLMVNREWLNKEKIRFFPGILYEDSLFSVECYLKAKKARCIGAPLYIYRVRENSIMTQKVSQKNLDSRIIVQCELKKIYENLNNVSDELKLAFDRYLEYIEVNADRVRKKIMLENNAKDAYFLREQFCARCDAAEEIILYGAGNVGGLVYHFLKSKKMEDKVVCFAISDEPCEVDKKNGLPIKNINSLINKYIKQLVVVSAGENYHKDMMELAMKVGFENIISINADLEAVLRG